MSKIKILNIILGLACVARLEHYPIHTPKGGGFNLVTGHNILRFHVSCLRQLINVLSLSLSEINFFFNHSTALAGLAQCWSVSLRTKRDPSSVPVKGTTSVAGWIPIPCPHGAGANQLTSL